MKQYRCKEAFFLLIIVALLTVTGCGADGQNEPDEVNTKSEPDKMGFVLKVDNDDVMIAEDISSEEYEEMKDMSYSDLAKMNMDNGPFIYELSYDDTDKLNQGDEVEVWMEDGLGDSDIQVGKAKKISIKE